MSLSARRAWIEIGNSSNMWCSAGVALRKESVDRNHIGANNHVRVRESLSARRAWIEITYVTRLPRAQVVALRKESVDRNYKNLPKQSIHHVALRKESVDRNIFPPADTSSVSKSLSARRAWIEIQKLLKKY